MMGESASDLFDLIPPPFVVRDRLARNIREARLLRTLLNLSIRAAEERRQYPREEKVKTDG